MKHGHGNKIWVQYDMDMAMHQISEKNKKVTGIAWIEQNYIHTQRDVMHHNIYNEIWVLNY